MHFYIRIVFVAFIACNVNSFSFTEEYVFQAESADAKLSTIELATKYGYRAENYEVETEDGYLLEIHRITGSGWAAYDKKLPPILLMHGLLASSADWLLIGPNNALAYELSDMGYDVWLGNARGNRYSRKHKKLSPDMVQFWDFSWHEIGQYDLPAMIDFVLEKTGKEQLHYVGHSQGTTAFFVMSSVKPSYNEKIILMQALAPVAFLEYMNSPLLDFFVKYINTISTLIDLFGLGEFTPIPTVLLELAKLICPSSLENNLCINALFLIAGANPEQVDPMIVPVLLGHIPAGSSTKQILHFGQQAVSARFCQYDYGKLKNIFVYGMEEPPQYNLTDVTAPIILHYGANDRLAHVHDVYRLAHQLPNLVYSHRIKMDLFNHMDFLVAKDVKMLLYQHVIDFIERFD